MPVRGGPVGGIGGGAAGSFGDELRGIVGLDVGEHPDAQVIEDEQIDPTEEMADLHADSHIFLLPAARVHIVSLLQAMSYGLPVVASDGWGFDEYIEDGRNGLVVRGRYGKVSWADYETGFLRENYAPTATADPDIVEGLVVAISRLVEDRELRASLGREARSDVEKKYNLAQWNQGLRSALDKARGIDRFL